MGLTTCQHLWVILFVLKFYGPVNSMCSCQARSVYLTTRLLGRLSPTSDWPVLCIFFRQKLITALLESAEENDRRKYFMINHYERMLLTQWGSNSEPPDHKSDAHPIEPPRPAVGHFVSSPREREKRDRRERKRDEREEQGRKRNRNESEETEEIKTFPLYPYLLQG